MIARKRRGVPARLESARRRFEQWRRTRKHRRRIPEPLWASAVKMAGAYGIHRTAKALRLHYYSLKERVEQQRAASGGPPDERSAACVAALPPAAASASGGPPGEGPAATFFELAPVGRAGSVECILELEDAQGAKMRVHLKGVEAPDLTALSRTFWGLDS